MTATPRHPDTNRIPVHHARHIRDDRVVGLLLLRSSTPTRLLLRLAGIIGLIVVAVFAVTALAGCSRSEPITGPRRQPTVAQPDPVKIREVCDYFYYRAVDSLVSDAAQGQVNTLTERPGVPDDLRAVTRHFYDDAMKPDTAERRDTLERRYAMVVQVCLGDHWVRP